MEDHSGYLNLKLLTITTVNNNLALFKRNIPLTISNTWTNVFNKIRKTHTFDILLLQKIVSNAFWPIPKKYAYLI